MGYAQDLVSKGFYGYAGWGDAEAAADFNATGGSGKGGPTSSSTSTSSSSGGIPQSSNVIDTARQLQQFNIESNQPAIQSLQASIPETTSKYATERQRLESQKVPLKDRYSNLLNQIKSSETADVKQQEIATAREFGRRGIPTTSGIAEQTLAEKLSPIRQYYTGKATETGISQEENMSTLEGLISSLTGQETESTRAIQNAIAALQAGDTSGAITQALGLLTQNNAATNTAAEQAWREKVYKETTLPESQANISNVNSTIANRTPTADDATSSAINSMMSFSGGDKSKIWQWIHTYEPEFKKQRVDSNRLWAMYNNL